MNRRMYETERLRGVHLSIIIVLTLCVLVVIATGMSMNWDENWVLPFLAGAVLLSWVFHIRQTFSAEVRLIIYAGVGVAVILFDGVQFTSVFDFAISIALAMTGAVLSASSNVFMLWPTSIRMENMPMCWL